MNKNIQDITLLGVMTAVIIVMFAIPGLGFIPLGQINATIVHIPVIIIAIVRGPKLGAILGIIFGIASMANALLRPTVTSFIFMNPIVAVIPRFLIGFLTGYIAEYIRKIKLKNKLDIILPAAIGSLTNTITVLSLIYLIYAKDYMQAIGKGGQSAIYFLFGIATTIGIAEMIVSVLIATPVSYALLRFTKENK